MDNEAQKPQETEGGQKELENTIEEQSETSENANVTTDEVPEKEGTEESSSEKVLDEIDQENAEDAEDTENEKRHHIPFLDYHAMSMENLVGELQRLVKNEKVQAINKHVNSIKNEFDLNSKNY